MAVTPAPTAAGADASSESVADRIIAEFRAAFRELRCVGSERMLRQGLSMGHLHAMSVLERHGEMTMSGLAETLDMSLSNATGLVDRMEERGLIERYRVPGDRRVVMVRITERGRETLAEADLLRDDMLHSILATLESAQLERLACAIEDVRRAVAKVLLAAPMSDWHDHAHRHGHAHSGDQRPPSPVA
jgi:DNA-binding MarR family transcriptional regulator